MHQTLLKCFKIILILETWCLKPYLPKVNKINLCLLHVLSCMDNIMDRIQIFFFFYFFPIHNLKYDTILLNHGYRIKGVTVRNSGLSNVACTTWIQCMSRRMNLKFSGPDGWQLSLKTFSSNSVAVSTPGFPFKTRSCYLELARGFQSPGLKNQTLQQTESPQI